jgi:hypothetical protein
MLSDNGALSFIQPTDSPDPGWEEEMAISYGSEGTFYITGTVRVGISYFFH